MITLNTTSNYTNIVDSNDYVYMMMQQIINAPKKDGDVLMYRNGTYVWTSIPSTFKIYNELLTK
jgi:hypothetical protein